MSRKGLSIVLLLLLLALTAVAGAASHSDATEVSWWWGDQAGSARIVRTGQGISGNVNSSLANDYVSAKGLAVTLWFVVFNHPSACATAPCSEADLFDPDVMPDVLYAAGNVVGGSQKASFGYHRSAGDNSGSLADLFGLPTDENGDSFGLIDPMGAEVHYVVRSHGPKVPANMPEQILTYGGGCEVDYAMPSGPDDLHFALGECQDVQFAIFQP